MTQRPAGRLDAQRKDVSPTPAETAFPEFALAAWLATNSADRKALREQLEACIAGRG